MKKLDRFQRWALITTAATYALIGVGGFVRAAGAGLGCPDWPKCFDRWIPPTDPSQVAPHMDPALFNVTKAWIEYTNRLIGVAIGFLIFITLVLAIKNHRKVPRILYPTIAAFVLVGVEGWLGGMVVTTKLQPLVLSAHLAFALLIVSLLLYASVCAFFPGGRPLEDLPEWRRQVGISAFATFILTLGQVALGAIVRGEVQLAAKQVPAIPRADWLATAGTIYGLHRAYAVVIVVAIAALVWFVLERARDEKWLRLAAIATGLLAVAQPLAGIGLDRLDLQPALQIFHLWAGSLLLGGLTVIALLAYRLQPSGTPASTAGGLPATARAK